MKILQIYKQFLPAMLGLAALGMATSASAATVTVDPVSMVNGFMSWTGPAGDGASGWGFADLTATHTPGVLTLGAAPLDDPNPYWYPTCGGVGPCAGFPGDKVMEASSYAEVPDLTFALGETVTFNIDVLSNTFVSGFTVKAFISDFTSDFGYNETTFLDITTAGSYSFDHIISSDPLVNGVTQWGFKVYGPNVWSTEVAAQGNIQISNVTTVIPVPAAVWLFGSGLVGLVGVARRRKAA